MFLFVVLTFIALVVCWRHVAVHTIRCDLLLSGRRGGERWWNVATLNVTIRCTFRSQRWGYTHSWLFGSWGNVVVRHIWNSFCFLVWMNGCFVVSVWSKSQFWKITSAIYCSRTGSSIIINQWKDKNPFSNEKSSFKIEQESDGKMIEVEQKPTTKTEINI